MTHFASSRFWSCYEQLSEEGRTQADKQFALLRQNSSHPSLRFKKVGKYWSARVDSGIRAIAIKDNEDLVWFWIGDHREYERLIKRG